MPDNPNPQGKASLPLLRELQAWRSREAPTRAVRDVLADYLTGLLVLSAEFSFRPVPGRAYHLYYRQDRWQLSLIAPDEWRPSRQRCYVGQCELRHDATWSVLPAPALEERSEVIAALETLQQGFHTRIGGTPALADSLPHYESTLPYYRRVLASGLAHSLHTSLERLGLERASSQELLHSTHARESTQLRCLIDPPPEGMQ